MHDAPFTSNMGCDKGHRFYSDRPEAWSGHTCGHTNERTQAGAMTIAGRCTETLSVLELGMEGHLGKS